MDYTNDEWTEPKVTAVKKPRKKKDKRRQWDDMEEWSSSSESEDDDDVSSNNAKQTSGTISQTEAWRTVTTTSSDITIINMVEVIQSIAEITAISCEGLGDIEVSAIDQREKPSLIQLKETLRKELKNPPAGFDLLKEYGVSAFKASTVWLRELDDHVKSRKLHVKADKKYAQPLKLEKFAGHKSVKTNIYEFLNNPLKCTVHLELFRPFASEILE